MADIDPHYIDKPYVLVPEKNGKKAYALLREALKRSGRAGVAKLVLRTRQHLCAVIPHGKALSLLILRFADELRVTSDLDLPEESLKKLGITSRELDMAEKLISGMEDKWQPERYCDDYRKDLLALIHARAKAGELNTVSKEPRKASKAPKLGKLVDLVALLKDSVAPPRTANGHGRKPAAHTARPQNAAKKHTANGKRSGLHTATSHRKSA